MNADWETIFPCKEHRTLCIVYGQILSESIVTQSIEISGCLYSYETHCTSKVNTSTYLRLYIEIIVKKRGFGEGMYRISTVPLELLLYLPSTYKMF